MAIASPFVFDFSPGEIQFGRGSVADLEGTLQARGLDRALVVCGRNVGANEAVMGPVRQGLGDALVAVFDRTTPEKRVGTAVAVAERADEEDVDALVPVGGGSSLDVAKVATALRADGRGLEEARREVAETGGISMPEDASRLTPVFPVPTTLAGADLSTVAGITVAFDDGTVVGTGVGGEALMPEALCYDPELVATTPTDILAASAMNGFDKGIEAIYSRYATAVTDATAVRGLGLLAESLPRLREAVASGGDPEAVDGAVLGTVLVQYGISTPGRMKLGLIHAFGHGLREYAGVQQGLAHGVLAPVALELLFDRVEARRDVLAEAFDAGDAPAREIVETVGAVRDGLGLPSRLRELEGLERDGLEEVARLTHEDSLMANNPEGFDPDVSDLQDVLESVW